MTRTGDSLLPAARNMLVAQALANPTWTHLLLVDADIGWHSGDVLRLLAHDRPFTCGLYRLKEQATKFDCVRTSDAAPDPYTGLIELDCAATGFVLLKREVFLRLIEAYPQTRITAGVGLFAGPDDQRVAG